jgi:hypothetical protein
MASEMGGERKRQRIIIAKEKDDTRYLDASTDEAWAKSALALLSERFRDGYWYHDPTADMHEFVVARRGAREELIAMSEETLASLPEMAQADLRRKILVAKRDAAEDQKEREQYLEIKQVVDEQDLGWTGKGRYLKPKAWVLLERRTEYEYERVGLREIEVPGVEEVSL